MAIPTPFSTACGVVINNNYDTVGTLTRANINFLTQAQVQALFTPDGGAKWNEMTSMLRTQFEMRACGVKRYGMYDWIMSSNKPGMSKLIDIKRQHKGPSLVQPFIMGRQMSVVNADYWALTGGAPQSGYTFHASNVALVSGTSATGPLTVAELGLGTGTDRVIRVISSYGVPLNAMYFLPGHFIYHINKSVAGVAQHGQWKILASHAAADNTFIDVLIQSANGPTLDAAGADVSDVDATPLTGLILLGSNNVHDVEAYCRNFLNVNPIKHVPFWYRTYRWGRRVDSDYEKMFQRLMDDNAWFEEFQDITIAERNRQDELTRQKQFVHDFFFSRAISAAQTLDKWADGAPGLEQIKSLTGALSYPGVGASVDPGTGGQLIGYRANQIGVYDLLKSCARVIDLQNQPLLIKTFCETYLYDIVRARKSGGRPATSIDVYTDSTTAGDFQQAFVAYVKAVFGDIIRLNVTPGKNDAFGFYWKSFELPLRPFGVTVNIITNEFFDDMLSVFTNLGTGDQGSRGRFLAILDMGKGGSIYPAILGSNRKTHLTGEIEKLAAIDTTFSCVMENPTIRTTLNSETVTAIVECPLNSLWVENFSSIVNP